MPTPATLPQDPGPFSSLFNYEDEAKKEEARKLQLQESEKKIMRTNAIGDAFRLLVEGIGGSQGATIKPRGINPGITNAASRIDALQDQSTQRMDRIKLTDLSNRSRNMQYKQALNADKQRRTDAAELQKQKMEYEQTKSENDYTRKRNDELTDQQGKRKNELTDQGTTQKNALSRQENQAKLNRETNAEYQKGLLASYNKKRDRTVRASKEDIPFIIPGTRQTIYINPAELLEMQSQLIGDKNKWDPTLDAALKDLMKNDAVKQESALLTLKKNWEKVKGTLGYEDNTTTTQPATASPLLPGSQPQQPQTYQQGAGPLNTFGNPAGVQPAQEPGTLAPDEAQFIQNISISAKHTPEQKRKAVFQYLTKQGYDSTSVKAYAEQIYQTLTRK